MCSNVHCLKCLFFILCKNIAGRETLVKDVNLLSDLQSQLLVSVSELLQGVRRAAAQHSIQVLLLRITHVSADAQIDASKGIHPQMTSGHLHLPPG